MGHLDPRKRGIHIGVALRALLLLLVAALGCRSKDILSPVAQVPPPIDIDDGMAWSPDGKTIVFHRRFASQLGPPGLYIIDRTVNWTGLIYPSDALWPRDPRFSPDGKYLAFVDRGQLKYMEVSTGINGLVGAGSSPVFEPDWGDSGRAIYYKRLYGQGGLWSIDRNTESDTALTAQGVRLFGNYPRWSHSLGALAFESEGRIQIFMPGTGTVHTVAAPPSGHQYLHPRWLPNSSRIIFTDIVGHSVRNLVVDANGGVELPTIKIGESEAFSPDGDSVIVADLDPADSTQSRTVLFVRPFDDATGSRQRQLTWFVEP